MQEIGEETFLLPRQARQRFVGTTGSETENTITFSACREYRSESTVNFFQDPQFVAAALRNGASGEAAGIPPGLRFTMEIMTPISADTSAAGDPFKGKLTEPLQDANHKMLAPRGALVEGRVLQVQIAYLPTAAFLVVLRPQSIEIGGSKVPLAAFRDAVRAPGQRREMILPEYWEPNSGIFQFQGEHGTIGSGFRSQWRTAAPRER
jgi:hypothetical protein